MNEVLVIFLLCTIGCICVKSDVPFQTCKRTWKKVGCYRDLRKGQRALPEQMVNIRDPTSNVYMRPHLKWKKFSESLQSLACQCAEIVHSKGYEAFGLQFYGECWSGANALQLYHQFGEAKDSCIMGDFQGCDNNVEQECVGMQSINYVYSLVKETKSPGDGDWSEWGGWTQCDKTCGTGKQVRERTCTNPPPDIGSEDCEGLVEEVQDCKLTECLK